MALERWVWLARIKRTQGRKGEVFAEILTDFPEKFSDRRQLWLLVHSSAGAPCDQMRLFAPVDFYISEHAKDPTSLNHGQELWIEVTVPPKGPPRPLQLAMKENGVWKPLAFE